MASNKTNTSATIALNRKARHNYTIEETFEAGVSLLGWEVKSLRDHRLQMGDSHVIFRKGEAYLLNAHISPLANVPEHLHPNPTRSRKLLLHRREIERLMGKVEEAGYTVVPLKMYWHRGKVKAEIALAKGKKLYDKRASSKARDWQREKARILKRGR